MSFSSISVSELVELFIEFIFRVCFFFPNCYRGSLFYMDLLL